MKSSLPASPVLYETPPFGPNRNRPYGRRVRWWVTFFLVLAFSHHGSFAQFTAPLKVDTLTFGQFDDRNPSLQHNSFFGPTAEWVVFEREENGSASIWGLRMDQEHFSWDAEITRISDLMNPGEVRLPDVAAGYTSDIPHTVAWEQMTAGTWGIWYSTRSDTDVSWSAPAPFAVDSIDNTGIQLRPIIRYVLAVWQRGTALLCSRIGFGGRLDTLQVGSSSIEGFDFDVNPLDLNGTGFVWTSQDAVGRALLLYRYLSFSFEYTPQWSPVDTLVLPVHPRNPWFIWTQNWGPSGPPLVAFEADSQGRSQVYFLDPPSTPIGLTDDSTADYVNPNGVFFPIIINRAQSLASRLSILLQGVSVVERRGKTDTSFVFWPGADTLYSDTLRNPGNNRNAVLGSPGFGGPFSAGYYPLVWESNRSGRWHLYGSFIEYITDQVEDDRTVPALFALHQNYPNPFNPSTTIEYTLPNAGYATLKVFNVLGEEVVMLVNGHQAGGTFRTEWDASGLPSGVYFYRLTAGGSVHTRKMVLMK